MIALLCPDRGSRSPPECPNDTTTEDTDGDAMQLVLTLHSLCDPSQSHLSPHAFSPDSLPLPVQATPGQRVWVVSWSGTIQKKTSGNGHEHAAGMGTTVSMGYSHCSLAVVSAVDGFIPLDDDKRRQGGKEGKGRGRREKEKREKVRWYSRCLIREGLCSASASACWPAGHSVISSGHFLSFHSIDIAFVCTALFALLPSTHSLLSRHRLIHLTVNSIYRSMLSQESSPSCW
ncbi:hypothetical protein BP00DRAFT_214256 [Aspergillus indologenus CBS 114.80]|uniref:Uncharacterized protein n=1 Tax=Aspergillus indologenus CBS 114.80 TaxID=1450541 RepID=A0A2V5I210_9EURO|nr:hypothetical protein BP00DRAFT_214256 [Aspergillus indologenus CBS 114.80]